jgi:tetratricopeptide (TPR) repeat protein
MGGTATQGFDPAALLVIVVIAGVGAALGIAALRRRKKVPRFMKLKRYRKRLDVIRRDLNRMVEYVGELGGSQPAVSQPVERGLTAMTACNWSQAIEHFHDARRMAGQPQLVPLLVQAGVCHYMQGSLGDALKEFGESARLADHEGDRLGRAAALADIGIVHHEYGDLGSALTHLDEALSIARESDNQRVVALCLGSIGNIQRDKGRLDDALKSHEGALAISRRIGDEPGVVGALGNTASVRRDKGELDKALELYAEAVDAARKVGDNFGYAMELGSIGGVYHDKGDLDRALKFHEDALAGARRIGFRLGVATELGNVGLILDKRGAHEQAVPNLSEAATILLSVGVDRGQIQVLLGLSRCDDALGQERMEELLKQAGLSDEGIAEMLERVDQIRRRRPWPIIRG